MNKIEGSIARIRKDKKAFQLHGDQTWYSSFRPFQENLMEGMEVEFEYKQNGDFFNIVSGSLIFKGLSGPRDVTNSYASPPGKAAAPRTGNYPGREAPDWDAIAEGKIRSLLLQAHVQKNGLVMPSEEEAKVMNKLVELAMDGEIPYD